MKKTLLIIMLSSMLYAASAQRVSRSRTTTTTTSSTSHFGVGVEAGLPIGQYGKVYSAIVGGSLQYEMMPDSDIGITINGGYQHWISKSTNTSPGVPSTGFIPLLAGVKYYFVPNAFFHAQLGTAIGTAKGAGASFAYSPGVGVKISPNVDATLKYTGYSKSGGTLDNVALRLGFNF